MEALLPAVKFVLYAIGAYFVGSAVIVLGVVALIFVLGSRR